jgi:DNA repair exonuclease SbcCD ATPase subunit
MLISLHMKCWRKHEDKTITFTEGLNAVRGANENGKTSMLLAIAYALWGVKVMPLPLAELVTWGHSEKEAKVTLTIKIGSELYSFVRHKNGAECNHSGGVVTGQDEVSKFASTLLGCDGQRAMTLMFAPQGELRGALNEGPTAISQYIEDMSGMDLFDRLMDIIGEKLTTGPTTKLDGEVSDLEAKIEAGGPVEPDLGDLRDRASDLERQLQSFQGTLRTAQATAQTANDAYTEAKAKADHRKSALDNLARAEHARDQRLERLEEDRNLASVEVDEARIGQIEETLRDEQAQEATRSAHRALSRLPTVEDEWEGDEASLKAAIASHRNSIAQKERSIASLRADIREAKAKLTTSSICGFCQQDLSQFPEVAKRNTEIKELVTAKEGEIVLLEGDLDPLKDELGTMEAVLASATVFNHYLLKYAAYVDADMGFVPPRLTWKGPAPVDGTDTSKLSVELSALKRALSLKTNAAARIEQTEKDLAADHDLVAQLKQAVPAEVDLTDLLSQKRTADTAVVEWTGKVEQCRNEIQRIESQKAALWAGYELAKRNFAQYSVDLEAKRAERDDLVFNNTLVKKIKAARPVIAAELWAVVLQSVSVMLTNMRGEQSVVTKGTKGFLVNDKPALGLSGSALDLLGFSIRVAMLKTFIPECSMLVLDEATSACDDDRTASLLGFIAGAGFPQTLLVTHEAAAESVADNVIMI